MSKRRLHEIAKEIGKTSKEVVDHAKNLGLDVKSHASSVEDSDAKKIISSFSTPKVEKSELQKSNPVEKKVSNSVQKTEKSNEKKLK